MQWNSAGLLFPALAYGTILGGSFLHLCSLWFGLILLKTLQYSEMKVVCFSSASRMPTVLTHSSKPKAATLYFTAWQNLWAVKLSAVNMHRPRTSRILKIVPNAKVYTEHSADLHVAPKKPSVLVPISTLIFSAWWVRNFYLHDQNSLALMG